MGLILNMGGLVLGIASAVLPIYALSKNKYRKANLLVFASLVLTVLALMAQVVAVQQRVVVSDLEGITNTADVIAGASVLVSAAVIVLDFFLLRAGEAYRNSRRIHRRSSESSQEKKTEE